ncbi:molybdate ABC transporter substrate-binding protein [Membranihabitans maritimus]|uniref:molybdate ABC transporter substrate-binding protein n=1 Tax=Membranihabitans maritimus TaxID=2904244 RepID=UPI001F01BE11|nr:molybdate ABC transporter substrate-binding protein [Membranihabitans maritimus]
MNARLYPISMFSLFILIFSSCRETGSAPLTIATAANMQFAMKALTEDFTNKTGIECDLIIGSSGKLTAQIKEGAPFDLFVSANMKYPQAIYEAGLANNFPEIYARGRLVLWTMSDKISPKIPSLSSRDIKHIALANPMTAPYGQAASEALQYYDLLDEISTKLVYGESISQTNQFITSGSAELGFTAMSVVLSPQMKNKGKWIEIPSKTYSPINQGVILIKRNSTNGENAKKFYNFIFSDSAKEILKGFGYNVDE